MLYLYTDKGYFNEDEFIFNVDTAITTYGFKINELTRKVIKEIDNADFMSESKVIDRFGNAICISSVSCSSKAVLLVNNLGLSKVVNFSEVCSDVGKLLCDVKDGRIYLKSIKRVAKLLSNFPEDMTVNVNNKNYIVKDFINRFGDYLYAYKNIVGFLPELHFNIKKNGLYFFNIQSGIGKTYLADSISSYCTEDIKEEFCVLTLKKGRGVSVSITGDINKAKVIVCDRFDTYVTEELFEKLCSLAEYKIVILDFKDYEDYLEKCSVKCYTGYVSLKLEESKIFIRG
mgnify:CR=1 FL=1